MEDIFKNIQIYHTLEDDYEDWKSFRKNKKLKLESDRDNDKSDKEEEIEQKNEKKDKKGKIPKGTSSTLSSRELRSLLSDATPTKKWQGSIQYENQDELYDALDNVLTKLKNHSEHSYPFLNRVRKSDAPDYYDIIKHPMDLGTMTKKLYRCEYSSKAEFQNDINLIFSNCRTYNTDPSAKIYLVHAEALEKKAKELMKSVKNIDFSQQRKENEELPTSPTSPKEERSSGSKKKSTTTTTTSSSNSNSNSNSSSVKKKNKNEKKKKKKEENTSDPDLPIDDDPYEDFDTNVIKISQVERFRYLKYRQEQATLPFGDRDALLRDPIRMATFVDAAQIPSSLDTYDLVSCLSQSKDEDDEDGFFPEISHFTSSVPDLYQPHTPLSPYAAQSPPVPKSLYQSSLIKSNPQLENLVRNSPSEVIGDEISVFPEDITIALLKKSIGIMCAHTGFEGTEENALDVLTDIISDYLLSVGKLLRLNYDNCAGKLDTMSLLNLTLQDIRLPSNGHKGVPALLEYIKGGHVTTGRFKPAVEVTETQQAQPTEHVSMLLDEETSQNVEKDPLDPLNDDFFPEKIASMQMNFEKAQSMMNTQQQQQQAQEEKEGGPLKRTRTQEEIVPAPAPTIPAAEEAPAPVERKGPRKRNMPGPSKRGKRKETY